MKFPVTTILCATIPFAQSVTPAALENPENAALTTRAEVESRVSESSNEELYKRKGGGGGGGRGGGGSSGGGSRSGGGSSGGGSSGGGSSSKTSPSSNVGGTSSGGSGVRPAYGGGRFYPGGAAVPYRSGSRVGSIVPFVVGGAAIGFLGAAYLAGAHAYPYTHQYRYYNDTTDQEEQKPVTCVCTLYDICSCEDNGDDEYFASIIGDGTYANLNKTLVNVGHNSTDNQTYIYILGTLPNGTTAADGTADEASGVDTDGPYGAASAMIQSLGWWPAVTAAMAMAFIV